MGSVMLGFAEIPVSLGQQEVEQAAVGKGELPCRLADFNGAGGLHYVQDDAGGRLRHDRECYSDVSSQSRSELPYQNVRMALGCQNVRIPKPGAVKTSEPPCQNVRIGLANR
jgi:hypothetical protein